MSKLNITSTDIKAYGVSIFGLWFLKMIELSIKKLFLMLTVDNAIPLRKINMSIPLSL